MYFVPFHFHDNSPSFILTLMSNVPCGEVLKSKGNAQIYSRLKKRPKSDSVWLHMYIPAIGHRFGLQETSAHV